MFKVYRGEFVEAKERIFGHGFDSRLLHEAMPDQEFASGGRMLKPNMP